MIDIGSGVEHGILPSTVDSTTTAIDHSAIPPHQKFGQNSHGRYGSETASTPGVTRSEPRTTA